MVKNVPDGWRIEKWDNVLEIKNGKNQKAVIDENGIYPIYGSGGNIMGYANDYLCVENTVIIGRKGSINNPIFIKEKFWNVDTAFGLISNRDILLPSYLYYFSLTFDFERLNTTTTIPSLTKERLKNILIPLPPLPQQKEIVKVLDISSQLIEKQKELIANYDLFLKSKFIEMFGDPIQDPMGWEVKKLKEISTLISSGSTPKGGRQVYVKSGILFFRSQNVWKNKILFEDIAYIDNETHLKMKKSSLKYKDILITKTGRFNTENSSLGRAALFLGEDNSANVNGHVYLVRLKEEMIPEFVVYILTTDEYRDYIRRVCVGGIDKRQINKTHLEEFPIIFPPIELQNKFASIVEKIETIKKQENKKLAHLETLHNSLMEKAFKGEIQ